MASAGGSVDNCARGCMGVECASAGPGRDFLSSKCPRNSCHSCSVGVRYSSLGRRARRRARNARVGLDSFGVGGLVAECDVDIPMPGYDLGDMWWQPIEDGIGDEHSSSARTQRVRSCSCSG